MPAPAVIPAPIAYIKVVAVKKLVVEHVCSKLGLPEGVYWHGAPIHSVVSGLNWSIQAL